MKDFRKLDVWQKSALFIDRVYAATSAFPAEERFVLTTQVRRAALSIAANIAEGCCRKGDAEFARFLYMAMGSASEVECCLEIGKRLGFLKGPGNQALADGIVEIKKMISSLIRKLNADRL